MVSLTHLNFLKAPSLQVLDVQKGGGLHSGRRQD